MVPFIELGRRKPFKGQIFEDFFKKKILSGTSTVVLHHQSQFHAARRAFYLLHQPPCCRPCGRWLAARGASSSAWPPFLFLEE
jgi:hypothetical protein